MTKVRAYLLSVDSHAFKENKTVLDRMIASNFERIRRISSLGTREDGPLIQEEGIIDKTTLE
jgi:hypothetical protein